ncbi:MAG: GspMb/PilO family protein [Anaerohalosphaeraceae bacterium]
MKFKLPNSGLRQYRFWVGGIWGLWLFMVAGVYFLILGPQQILLARQSKDFNVSNEQYSLAQIAQRKETKSHLETRLKEETEKAARFVVSSETMSGLTLQISQLASQYNLVDFSTKTRDLGSTFGQDSKAQITDAWLEMSFTCSFNQFITFLNSLERSQPVVFIESAQITRDTDSQNPPRARVLISYLADIPQNNKTESDATGK